MYEEPYAYVQHELDHAATSGNEEAYHTYTFPTSIAATSMSSPCASSTGPDTGTGGWVLDTGATCHFSNDIGALHEVEGASSSVETADGNVTPIIEKGVAHVITPAGCIKLKNVHHAPTFSRPLISVTKLVDQDRAVLFFKDRALMVHTNQVQVTGEPLLVAERSGNLFVCGQQQLQPHMSATFIPSTDISSAQHAHHVMHQAERVEHALTADVRVMQTNAAAASVPPATVTPAPVRMKGTST